MIGSVLLFGVLVLTIGRVQTGLNTAMYANSFTQITQRNAVQLAHQIEHDFAKIGFHVSDPAERIKAADSLSIKFKADLMNNGSVDQIEYRIGTKEEAAATMNVADFPLYRKDSNGEIMQLWGTTRFNLKYYNIDYNQFPSPVPSDSLPRIYAVWVTFVMEGREPAGSAIDTTYYSITWQKLIYPRNMGLSY